LLEGLEISVMMKSELEFENYTKRIDSEYFQKHYLKNIEKIKKNGFTRLKENVQYLSGGATPLGAEYENEGIPFLRVQNIMQNYFNLNDVVYINKKQDEEIKRTRLKERDVLLTITGVSFGKSAVVPKELSDANINQHSVKITLDKNLNPYFLSTFLNCSFGKLQSNKNVVGVTRPALDYDVIKNFNIPKLQFYFQNKIEELINESTKITKSFQLLYSQAEEILLQELGLNNKNIDHLSSKQGVEGSNPFANAEKKRFSTLSINVKNFKDSFGLTGRLDAEYYQKKYEVIIEKIKTQKYDTLKSITTINKSIEPGSNYYSNDETGLPFMRISDFSKFGLTAPNKRLTLDFVKDNQDKIDDLMPKKNTILFSKDGTVGIAHQLREDFKGITSSAILHLKVMNENEVLPEYLTLALNSKLVQMQAERDAGGSIIQHWRKEEIENVIVPIIDYKKQQEIAQLIEESFSLKKQSEHLLEVAKRAVEIAIEENEEVANKYINQQL
jgi:type I restriction enzyme S subunit